MDLTLLVQSSKQVGWNNRENSWLVIMRIRDMTKYLGYFDINKKGGVNDERREE